MTFKHFAGLYLRFTVPVFRSPAQARFDFGGKALRKKCTVVINSRLTTPGAIDQQKETIACRREPIPNIRKISRKKRAY